MHTASFMHPGTSQWSRKVDFSAGGSPLLVTACLLSRENDNFHRARRQNAPPRRFKGACASSLVLGTLLMLVRRSGARADALREPIQRFRVQDQDPRKWVLSGKNHA